MMNEDIIHIIFRLIRQGISVASDYPKTSLMLHSSFKSYIRSKHRLKLQTCRRVKNVNTAHHADPYTIL